MSLRFAILTALTERESTGLDLARRFDRSIGYFWPASHQQIYRELNTLETSGLVEMGPPPAKPTRGQAKVFRITHDGSAELSAWVAKVDAPAILREPLLVKLRAAALLGDLDGLRRGVEHHLAAYEEMLVMYRAIEQQYFSDPTGRKAILQHLVLQGGLQLNEAWVTWHRQILDALDALGGDPPE